ncbi:unnamed protein product [Linum trigynum]|uniref:Uncharacterized protein n=1 Tax=Linum trigynum TaxID=586398 RepID=A0AAV2DVB7_9ROSI
MERLCEELDEAKAEIERLRGDLKSKSQSFDNLKRSHNDQIRQLQSAQSEIESRTHEISAKEGQIQELTHEVGKIQRTLNEKESIVRGLSSANDKLRFSSDDQFQKWEEEKRHLMASLDEANEKDIDQQQKINVLRAEIEGLKGMLSTSEKKCLESEKQAKAAKALRDRDDVMMTLEEQKMKVEEKLKWKSEQFKHLEEAHKKLRFEFKENEKEWKQEKTQLVDEICSLQESLDSQTRISQDLQSQLKMCNHALAREESQRKALDVEVSDFKKRFENVYTDYQDAKSQLECLTAQRDNEIAALRHSLLTKETRWKEVEYQSRKLEQENQELLESLKELREAQIQEAGNGSSLAKLKNKLRSVEQVHRDCAATLRAKEAEWSSQVEKLTAEVAKYQFALESSEAVVKELEIELENCRSALLQMKLQNEEAAIALLVLKSGVAEAQSNLRKAEAENSFYNTKKVDEVSSLMKQLEMKDVILAKAQMEIEEERRKVESLQLRVEDIIPIEEQKLVLEKEVARYREMLEASSGCHFHFKEQALQAEKDLQQKIETLCNELDMVNSELVQEREKVVSLSTKAEALDRVEEKLLLQEKELERQKQMVEESYNQQRCLEEKAFQTETNLQEMIREISDALDETTSELAEERERIESISLLEEQKLGLQKEVERHKRMLEESLKEVTRYSEMLEESSGCHFHFKEQALQSEKDLQQKIEALCNELDMVNSELVQEREKVVSLSTKAEALDRVEEKLLLQEKELERQKQMVEESYNQQRCFEEKAFQTETNLQEMIREISDALDETASELAEERERIESVSVLEEQKLGLQKEVERHMGMLEESLKSLHDLQKEAMLKENGLKDELKEVRGALDSLSSELAVKMCEGNAVEFELWIWKSIAQRLNDDLEENQMLRKELEASLLSQVDITENLKRQIEFYEQESLRRELEGAVLTHMVEERGFKDAEMKEKMAAADIYCLENKLESQMMEMREVLTAMEGKLRTSEALVDELMNEKRGLSEEVLKLTAERENVLTFLVQVGDRISEFSAEDMQLMKMLENIVVDSSEGVKGRDGGGKENIDEDHHLPSPTMMKRYGAVVEERSPFRELNG